MPSFEDRKYDPDKAKQLLAEAGYPDGLKTTYYAGIHLAGDETEVIQSYLNNVNIETDVEMISIGKWIEMETKGWEDGLVLSPTPISQTYGVYLLRFWVRPNEPNWSTRLYWAAVNRPDELENLIQEFIVIPEDNYEQIRSAAQEIALLLHDQALGIPLFEFSGGAVMQTYVHDTQYGKWTSGFDYVNAWMSNH